MNLYPQARMWFAPKMEAWEVDGTPVPVSVTGWEASFDHCETWVPSQDTGFGIPGWLVAGPDFPGGGDDPGDILTDQVITHTTEVFTRLRDIPETVVADPLLIHLLKEK